MKISEINRTFLASDVYKRWKRAIESAETDVSIFTPYFDKTLLTLLSANSVVARDKMVIVTNISSENALEMPYQLRAAKRAISTGVSVRSLEGLHAKVLLVDQRQVSVGSQNFTIRGRRNKETTVLPQASLHESSFIKTLQAWRLESREVSEEEIDELLSELSPLLKKHKKLHDEIEAISVQVRVRQQEKARVLRRHLEELELQSKIKLSQKTMYARLKSIEDYETLKTMNPTDDFTSWVIQENDRSVKPYSLDRLYMYPIILADSNRMGFARLGKNRITYVRDSVVWNDRPWLIGTVAADVSMQFETTETERQNIAAVIRSRGNQNSCTFTVTLNGKGILVTDRRFKKSESSSQEVFDTFQTTTNMTLLNSTSGLSAFFGRFLQRFRYSELGVRKKSAATFFEKCWYSVSVIQIESNPILVFAKCQ